MVALMMAGNSFCLLAHLLKARVVDTDREVPVNILILLPAALMDLGGEILSNMGLVFLEAAVRGPIRYVDGDVALHSRHQIVVALDFLCHVVWTILWLFYVSYTTI